MLAKVKAKASELLAEGLAEKALEKYSELIKTGHGWSGMVRGQGLQHMQKLRKRLCMFVLCESLQVVQTSASYQVVKPEHLHHRQWVTTRHDIILAGLDEEHDPAHDMFFFARLRGGATALIMAARAEVLLKLGRPRGQWVDALPTERDGKGASFTYQRDEGKGLKGCNADLLKLAKICQIDENMNVILRFSVQQIYCRRNLLRPCAAIRDCCAALQMNADCGKVRRKWLAGRNKTLLS